MAYMFYLDKMLLPVSPSKVQLNIENQNKTITLINDGEINILKKPGLTDVEFDFLLPNVKYPFSVYKNGFQKAKYFLEQLENLRNNKMPFQFIVTRELPTGSLLQATNIKVSLEDYKIKEDAKQGFDVVISIKLKQYKDFGTKICKVTFVENKVQTDIKKTRETSNSPKTTLSKTYTVLKGDCLWGIAKKLYGNGSKYTVILNANKDKIKNANLIYPGQILTIPSI